MLVGCYAGLRGGARLRNSILVVRRSVLLEDAWRRGRRAVLGMVAEEYGTRRACRLLVCPSWWSRSLRGAR
jgi:hypothetical protein